MGRFQGHSGAEDEAEPEQQSRRYRPGPGEDRHGEGRATAILGDKHQFGPVEHVGEGAGCQREEGRGREVEAT